MLAFNLPTTVDKEPKIHEYSFQDTYLFFKIVTNLGLTFNNISLINFFKVRY
ncbi:protein of unknown function [Streptococcus thermophilus]|nr:protein of unknown function [Streptococcus thermophilus]